KVDLSARAGTGHDTLPFTGSLGPGRTDVADHVPFGAMAPNRWQMFVTYDGALEWAVYEVLLTEKTAPVSFDSVPAGGVKSGFGGCGYERLVPRLPGRARGAARDGEAGERQCLLAAESERGVSARAHVSQRAAPVPHSTWPSALVMFAP